MQDNEEKNFYAQVEELLEQKKYKQIKYLVSNCKVVEIADILNEITGDNRIIFFRMLPKDLSADVFSFLDADSQEHIINSINDIELGTIINDLYIDDAMDVLEELPSNVVNRILKVANQRTRDYINQFLKYKENSAGSIMTVEFITMKVDMNVQNAFDYIRDNCADKGTIYDCFVIDNSRKLLGVITVRELLRHKSSDIIGDFMDRNIISVKTDVDREEVARIFNEYDLLSMPVVDMSGRIVGIVTIDDVVDVMEAEATEDFQKMAALTPNEKPYMKTGVFELAKHRILWLSILMVSAFFSGMILTKYEDSFAIVPLLVTFIPMLMDTGGNAGSQVSTLIIRGMATGDIYPKDIGQIIWKEFRVSLIVGSILALFNFGRLALQYGLEGETLSIIITVCLSLMIVVILAKMLGCILPIVAKVFHMDPAIMAAPLITTIVDATSLFIYFEIASTLVASLSA